MVATTEDLRLNARIARVARPLRVLVNAVDDPRHCDVTIPAVLRRGPATIAITTDGASPAAARFLRERIEESLPPAVGDLVTEAGRVRQELRRRGTYRYDYAAWEEGLLTPGLRAVSAGCNGAIDELGRRFLDDFVLATPRRRTGTRPVRRSRTGG